MLLCFILIQFPPPPHHLARVIVPVPDAIMGVPSFAISLSTKRDFKFKPAAEFALRLASFITKNGVPDGTILNVNVPDTDGKEISRYRITSQGKNTHNNTIEEKIDPRGMKYYWIGRKDENYEEDDASDIEAISQEFISITPLRNDRTHHSSFEELLQWDL